MSNDILDIYDAVYAYVEDSYKQQAADEGIEWTQDHNEFVERQVTGIYGQVSQAVEIFMAHFAEPLPTFDKEETND